MTIAEIHQALDAIVMIGAVVALLAIAAPICDWLEEKFPPDEGL